MPISDRLRSGFASVGLAVVALLVAGVAVLSQNVGQFQGDIRSEAAVLSSTGVLSIQNTSDIANLDGSSQSVGSNSAWIGNGQNVGASYLGLRFQGDAIPQGAQITSAIVEFSPKGTQWIQVATNFKADKSTNSTSFSSSNRLLTNNLTSASSQYSDNVRWEEGKWYSYDVTPVVQELVNISTRSTILLVAKGTGGSYGRKFIYSDTASGRAPKLTISYTTSSGGVATNAPSTVNPTSTSRPTTTSRATPTPTIKATATAMSHPTIAPTQPPVSGIFGQVSDDLLGTCSRAIHDKYVTTGPDGKVYRTWHPAKDPSGCTFAHEHGDDPATANNYIGKAVPFGYIAAQLNPPMDEPHAGFKCFVHNKGTTNDEGGVMLHDSYYCFHMGTGGVARFTARFHSLDMHVRTSTGAVMNVQGMADVGNVGTICQNPRQQRTVQGFGCLLDSAYEIWENKLAIRNKGQTVASAIASTAVFDPITSMDPTDKSRVVYSWSEEAQQKIFKFRADRTGYRGCNREAYSGPLSWYNQGGSTVYYTDPYGNVIDGGVLKQEISTITNRSAGTLDQYGALIMTYKGGRDPQSQFKYRKSACVPGLGVKN